MAATLHKPGVGSRNWTVAKPLATAETIHVVMLSQRSRRCYKPGRAHERAETWREANPEGRWRCFSYGDLLKRDKLSLDLFWIKDKTLTDTDSLPPPDIIAAEIADDLEAALELNELDEI
jgi:hypothetical protein